MKRPLMICENCAFSFYAPRKNDGTTPCPQCGHLNQVED